MSYLGTFFNLTTNTQIKPSLVELFPWLSLTSTPYFKKNKPVAKEGIIQTKGAVIRKNNWELQTEFDAKVVLKIISGTKSAAEICLEHNLKPY